MPIIRFNKEMQAKYHGLRPIARIYHGTQLVWEATRSCYGSGVWKNDRPWLNSDVWKNKP